MFKNECGYFYFHVYNVGCEIRYYGLTVSSFYPWTLGESRKVAPFQGGHVYIHYITSCDWKKAK